MPSSSSSGRVYAVGSGSRWDESRNTSRRGVTDPKALERCLAALAELRRSHPELVAWVEAGAPRLTEAEHRARFGCDYSR